MPREALQNLIDILGAVNDYINADILSNLASMTEKQFYAVYKDAIDELIFGDGQSRVANAVVDYYIDQLRL